MAVTTTSTLDDLFTNIVAQARFTAEEESLMLGLVTQYNIAGQAGKTIQVPKYPAITASAVAEGNDLSDTAVSTTSVPVTVSEVGAMVTLKDMALYGAGDPASELGTVLGNSIATKIDVDLLAEFANFTSEQGTVGGALQAVDIFKAVATLKANKARGQLYGVIHPNQAYALKAQLTNTFAPDTSNDLVNEAMRNGFIGTIAGVQMYESANVKVDYTDLGDDNAVGGQDGNADTADQAVGAIFTAEGLCIAMKNTFNLETQRDASARANELVATAVYGTEVLDQSFGVKLVTKKTL